MKCDKVQDLLYLYSGDDLSSRQARKVRSHLATCRACSSELARIQRVVNVVAASHHVDASEAEFTRIWNGVQARLASAQTHAEKFRRRQAETTWASKLTAAFQWCSPAQGTLAFALVAILLLAAGGLFVSRFLDKSAKELAGVEETGEVSPLSEYPVVEFAGDPRITVLTFQTDDPRVTVVWFFDENFRM